ncbi:MAG: histidinol-phosphatase HisJ family protein [Clostridiaceae bacterium]|nr:histidinol-phosphatase HisJ family protein [Clostridiaceae bacterium]
MAGNLFDYHLHSRYSPDGNMKIETIVNRARELGLDEICITDHVEVDSTFGDEWQTSTETLRALLDDLNRMQELTDGFVKKGVELAFPDHNPGTVKDMVNLVNPDDFDFIIVSLHQYQEEYTFSDTFFKNRTLAEGAATYIRWINERIREFPTEYYDVLGHIDFVVKGFHGCKDPSLNLSFFEEELGELFRYLIDNGKTLEVNTSAFRALPGNKVHGHDWLTLFAQMGGEYVTIGSDAHKEEHVGYRLKDALNLIREAGIPYLATFDKRRAVMHKVK